MNTESTAQIDWQTKWENEITSEEQEALTQMLARIYPEYVQLFQGSRSWSGARPELRIVGYVDGKPIGHLGILRRFLRIPEQDKSLLIGDVGLVGIDPAYQKTGTGKLLLLRTTQVMRELALPFGFLTCRTEVVPFYESGGWQKLDGQITRMIDNDHQVETLDSPAMALPILAPLSDWPHGFRVDRNGLEV